MCKNKLCFIAITKTLIGIGNETLARHSRTNGNLQLENVFPAEYGVSAVVQSEVEGMFP